MTPHTTVGLAHAAAATTNALSAEDATNPQDAYNNLMQASNSFERAAREMRAAARDIAQTISAD